MTNTQLRHFFPHIITNSYCCLTPAALFPSLFLSFIFLNIAVIIPIDLLPRYDCTLRFWYRCYRLKLADDPSSSFLFKFFQGNWKVCQITIDEVFQPYKQNRSWLICIMFLATSVRFSFAHNFLKVFYLNCNYRLKVCVAAKQWGCRVFCFLLGFFLIHVSPGSYNIQYGWLIKSLVTQSLDVAAEELNERRCIISRVHVIFCSCCISLVKCEFLSKFCLWPLTSHLSYLTTAF